MNLKYSLVLVALLGFARAEAAVSRVFVVNTKGASVSLVDLAAQKEIHRISVGEKPYGIALTRDGKVMAVGVEGEQKIKFYDTGTFKLKGETRVGPMQSDHIVLSQDGRHILVASYFSDAVVGIDIGKMKEEFRLKGLSAPHVVKYGPLKRNAYVTCKKTTGIGIIDPASRKVVAFHPLNVNPRSLTFSPDESKLYFGSFWVDGFFEMDAASGKVTRLLHQDPPKENTAPQEVTYHGVESVGGGTVLAANEGRSYVDAVDLSTGKLLDRLTDVSKPCCIEKVPSSEGEATRVLVSNVGDGTLRLVEVSTEGKLKLLGKVAVGEAPKRVAFMPETSESKQPSE